MLNVDKVNVAYGDIQVLWDVSFKVEKNEFVVLVGSNGAGKSTTLKALSHLVDLKSGALSFEDQRLDKTPSHKIVDLGIAHVPEARQLFPEMTVQENLLMGSVKRGKKKRHKNLEWVYELFPRLKERRKQHAGTMSGGEQQMCAIGRGLMSDPKLMLFDEPSLGLSPLLTQEIFRLVRKIHDEGMTILMVEQNVKQTLGICDRAYVLENGRIELEGKGKDLLEDDRVKQAFLGI